MSSSRSQRRLRKRISLQFSSDSVFDEVVGESGENNLSVCFTVDKGCSKRTLRRIKARISKAEQQTLGIVFHFIGHSYLLSLHK